MGRVEESYEEEKSDNEECVIELNGYFTFKDHLGFSKEEYSKLSNTEKAAIQIMLVSKYSDNILLLMNMNNEFRNQANAAAEYIVSTAEEDEMVVRGAILSCTHGNRNIRLDACKSHGVYRKGNPVMTCKDCKVGENIYDFGACGNGKFEPVYYDNIAPHPNETAINKEGRLRYKCYPLVGKKWGVGPAALRSDVLGGIMQGAYEVKDKDKSRELAKEYAKRLKTGYVDEYVEILTKKYSLLCVYGGIITVEENLEVEEEDEEKNIEYVEEDNWLKLYYNPTGLGDGRSVLKHPRAANLDWGMEEELKGEHNIDWFETSSPAHDYIEQKGGVFDAHKLDNGLYVDSQGRYWVAVGPNVVNPNHSNAKSNKRIDVSEVFPGTKLDIKVQCEKEGENYGEIFYIPAVVGDVKEHSYPDGLYQTGEPFCKELKSVPSNPNTVEFIGYGIEQKVYQENEKSKSCINITNNYRIMEIIVYDGEFNY